MESNAIYKPEENKLVLTGTLVKYVRSYTDFDKTKEPYQISILTSDLTPEIIADLMERYFFDTKDKYLPSFIKKCNADGYDKPVYVNVKTDYPFGTYIEGEGNKRYEYNDVLDLNDGMPPLGSEVKLACRLKDSGIYPMALMIITLKKVSVDDFFA